MRLDYHAPAAPPPTKSSTTTSRSCWSSASATCAITHSVAAALRDADVVFNAAALKQVPTCEYFPFEAVQTNIAGAGEHRPRHPRARPARRDRGRHLDRQGLQAGQRDGHDQGDPGAGLHHGEPALPEDALHLRALRQRARLARLGDPAVPRADPQRRPGHHHHRRHDPLPAQPRPGGGHDLRGAREARAAARPTSRACRRPG